MTLPATPAIRRRPPVARAAMLGATALLAACGSSAAQGAPAASGSKAPLVIGVTFPTTGPYGIFGNVSIDGMKVAVQDINKAGGILGRQVKLDVRDDGGDVSKATLAVKDLLDNDKVDLMMPGSIAQTVLAILPITTQRTMTTITQASSIDTVDLTKFPYSFQMTFPTTSQGQAIACVLQQDSHLKVGTLTTGDKGGVTLMGAMVKALQSKGITVAAQQQFALDATSAVSQVQALKSAGVDAVVIQAAGTALSTAASAFQALGWNIPIVFTQGSVSTNLDKYVPASIAANVKAVVVSSQARPSETELPPTLKPFIQELAAIAPVQDLSVSIIARDVIYAYKWAIEKAGSTNGDKVRAALETISTANLPTNYFYSFPNPNFTATDHSTDHADLSKFWGVVKVSKLLDGTYVGGPAPSC